MACSYYHGIETFECSPWGEYPQTDAISWAEAETDNGDIKTGNVTKITDFNKYGDAVRVITAEGESADIVIPVGDRLKPLTITVGKKIVYSKYDD